MQHLFTRFATLLPLLLAAPQVAHLEAELAGRERDLAVAQQQLSSAQQRLRQAEQATPAGWGPGPCPLCQHS